MTMLLGRAFERGGMDEADDGEWKEASSSRRSSSIWNGEGAFAACFFGVSEFWLFVRFMTGLGDRRASDWVAGGV